MPDVIANQDLPPGAPTYAAGPLANVPSAAALRASGQTSAQFLAPTPFPIVPPRPSATPYTTPPLTLGERAAGLIDRARSGITNLLGLAPVTVPTAPPLPNRTAALENDLNALERRSSAQATARIPNFYDRKLAQADTTTP